MPEGYYSSWASYNILFQDEAQRDEVRAYLQENGIPTMIYYPKGLHQQKVFEHCDLYGEELPVTTSICKRTLAIPVSPYLKEEDQDKIIRPVSYTHLLSAGTAAIHMALKAAGVKKGDIVFCQDLTFSATANPIIYEDAVPVFIDSDEETWNMSPDALERAFEKYPDVKAVMPVHLYGLPANICLLYTSRCV